MPPTDGSAVMAANGLSSNGIGSSGHEKQSPNGQLGSISATDTTSSTAPALDQSWRQSAANKPLGRIIQRLANSCLKDLRETVVSMAQSPIALQAVPASGISSHILDKSEVSLKKKRQLIDFASGQRDRFIKTLVLSDWSRREEETARLVDIKVWQEKEINAQRDALYFIGLTKRDMFAAKMPNPNIEGALEILSTGQLSRQPHLGYIPPKRLTAKQLLRTLQDMNVTLTTRLNLDEELPSCFNTFTIANGRATFSVEGEFEVDLSVADEDTSSSFYFIDLRFSFQPRPKNLVEGMRAALEGRVNYALSTKGLQGCYDFLHNLVLTHKLNVLRQQAVDLMQGQWFGCLKIEDWRRVHRVLVAQYWTELPGKKSWIEFGIVTGKQKGNQLTHTPTPQLNMRWLREKDHEVTGHDIDIDWVDLDFKKILRSVMAHHISWFLGQVKDSLKLLAGPLSQISLEIQTSTTEPEDVNLRISLPGQPMPVTVSKQIITGSLVIHPATPTAAQAQHKLNSDSNREPRYIAQVLAHLLGNDVRERIGRAAGVLGWRLINVLRQDPKAMEKLFGPGVLTYRVYQCHQSWTFPWALVLTVSLAGAEWWITRLDERRDAASATTGRFMASARKIRLPDQENQQAGPTRRMLLEVEQLALAEVSYVTIAKDLDTRSITYKFKEIKPLTMDSDSLCKGKVSSTVIFIPAFELAPMKSSQRREKIPSNPFRISYDGAEVMDSENSPTIEIRHELRVQTSPYQLATLRKYVLDQRHRSSSSALASSLAMNESGALSIRINAPLGQPFIDRLQERLRVLDRMDHHLHILNKYKLDCTIMNLSRMRFIYCKAPELIATLSFDGDGGLPMRLKLEPTGQNPHHRIRTIIEQCMNASGRDGLLALIHITQSSLPLLQVVDKTERALLKDRSFEIHPRSAYDYHMKFSHPLPAQTFNISLRSKRRKDRSQLLWRIAPSSARNDLSADVQEAMDKLFRRQGDDWWGANDCIIAQPSAAGEALQSIVDVISRFKTSEDAPAATQTVTKQKANVPAKTNTSQSNVLPRTNAASKHAPARAPQQPSRAPALQGKNNVKPKQEVIELD